MKNKVSSACCAALLLFASACSKDDTGSVAKASSAPPITNRLHLPPEVVSNLGITFATVKTEALGDWKELPGILEAPEAKRFNIVSPTNGRLASLKPLWSSVTKGSTIAEIASPQLLSLQQALVTAANALDNARVEADQNGASSHRKLRLKQMERSFRQELNMLSVVTGLSPETLLQTEKIGAARWLNLTSLTVIAPDDGIIVEVSVSPGEFLNEGKKIASIYNLNELLFRGTLPEAHRGRVSSGANIRIRTLASGDWVATKVQTVLPVTDEASKSIVIEARIDNSELKLQHGLSAVAQVLISGGESEEAVIPKDCIVADGLEMVVYRKDPEKLAYVVRTAVEVGARSGAWISILSGLMEGDEVVCAGIHQLKLTGLGKAPQGGHFHADGTWHEGDK